MGFIVSNLGLLLKAGNQFWALQPSFLVDHSQFKYIKTSALSLSTSNTRFIFSTHPLRLVTELSGVRLASPLNQVLKVLSVELTSPLQTSNC